MTTNDESELFSIPARVDKSNGELSLVLLSDNAFPDSIVSDGRMYRQERTCHLEHVYGMYYKCSECGRQLGQRFVNGKKSNYCPNCGAMIVHDTKDHIK